MILVDPGDAWILDILPWRISTKGYVEATMYDGEWRKTVKFHHFITGTPVWEGEHIDHINRDKLDNRRENLRWVNSFASSQNRDFVDRARNIRVAKGGKFEVRIQREGVLHQVGTFNTEQEAIHARDEWFKLQGDVPSSH
jgi:hypothetical protein